MTEVPREWDPLRPCDFALSYNLSEPSALTSKSGDIIIPVLEENDRGEGEGTQEVRSECFVKCADVCRC